MDSKAAIFEVKGICKSFGETNALTNVSMSLYPGQIHGLIGENGSGKSTVSAIAVSAYKCDSGEMYLAGQKYAPSSVYDAARLGVRMVMQEQGTFPNITASANIFIGQEKRFVKNGFLNTEKMNEEARKALCAIGAENLNEKKMASELSFEERKLIELARAMYDDPKMLIIDETSTALSREGRDLLYGCMRKVRDLGGAVLFITHDIDELMEMSDIITVLRDGFVVRTLEKSEFDASLIKELMIGRVVDGNYYRDDLIASRSDEIALEATGVTYKNLKDLSFKLYKGEILGIGGLSGCGMHDLGKLLFGALPADLGTIKVNGSREIKSVQEAVENKIAYIAKDRDTESLLKTASIKDNICMVSFDKVKTMGLISSAKEKKYANEWAKTLNVKMQNIEQYTMNLSGGNKQKVVLARWLAFDADIYILDCPTRGIDVGVKAAIYDLLKDLKSKNKAIVIISEELPELVGMCDRLIIIKDGVVNGEFERSENMVESTLIHYMV